MKTKAQDMMGAMKYKNSSSIYKGVSWHAGRNKWRVQIRIDGKQTYIGGFDNEEVAAKAYDEAARYNFKQYARLNFPETGELGALGVKSKNKRINFDTSINKWHTKIVIGDSSYEITSNSEKECIKYYNEVTNYYIKRYGEFDFITKGEQSAI